MIEIPAQLTNKSATRDGKRRAGDRGRHVGTRHLTDPIRLLLTGPHLDARILAGEDAAGDTLLARRAQQLVSRRSRRRLIQGLERALAPPPARPSFSSAVSCNRQAVDVARPALEQLAASLRARNQVQPQGVILIHQLLTDPCGPLYHPAEVDELYEVARQALRALAPDPATRRVPERRDRRRGLGARAERPRRSRSPL